MSTHHTRSGERPAKRIRLLAEDSASDSDENAADDGLAGQGENPFNINEEFAKRFVHNKKREELHQLQEKYGNTNGGEMGGSDDSESESEDDEGLLVTEALDAEILDTLKAIQSKDPRVYDKTATFYGEEDSTGATEDRVMGTKAKPMYLKDYHRKNLMDDMEGSGDEQVLPTYADEQSSLKRNLIDQMHTLTKEENSQDDSSGGEDFLVKKPGKAAAKVKNSSRRAAVPVPDITTAERDPETFLSNFMAARAWVPSGSSRFQPFESDSEEEDQKADNFEEAYNLRFENPKHANEKLLSHSREAAAKYSVRREEPKGRKRAREVQKEQQDAEKLEREEEKARYRNLKIEEAQEKLNRFKEAAGMKRDIVPVEEWSKFLDSGWDDEKWDREMAKRFGESYYADADDYGSEDGHTEKPRDSKKKVHKPTWNDDIDIADIIPDFVEDEKSTGKDFTLTDEEAEDLDLDEPAIDDRSRSTKKSKKDMEQARADRKKQARKERRKLEELVDQSLATELPAKSSKVPARFQYRETSPSTYGLSAREILMADDSQLNQFVGLKKLASYRDPDKKSKDKKKLGKKARLRQWRKDTFGDENGPKTTFQEFLGSQLPDGAAANGIDITADHGGKNSTKKKKRSHKGKKAVKE